MTRKHPVSWSNLGVALLGAALVAGACRHDDGGVDGDEMIASLNAPNIRLCNCFDSEGLLADQGYDDAQSCIDDATPFSDGFYDLGCVALAFEDDRIATWAECFVDKLDEFNACIEARGCGSLTTRFECDGPEDTIPGTWECDGERDCDNGRDEENCDGRLCMPPEAVCGQFPTLLEEALGACLLQFTCDDGSTVPLLYQCDGVLDCDDGSDEASCPLTCNDGTMVEQGERCDGTQDCPDGSDELGCPFVCDDGSQIVSDWVCDGFEDCPDGSDEANC